MSTARPKTPDGPRASTRFNTGDVATVAGAVTLGALVVLVLLNRGLGPVIIPN